MEEARRRDYVGMLYHFTQVDFADVPKWTFRKQGRRELSVSCD